MKADCTLCGLPTEMEIEDVPCDCAPPWGTGELLPVRHLKCHEEWMDKLRVARAREAAFADPATREVLAELAKR